MSDGWQRTSVRGRLAVATLLSVTSKSPQKQNAGCRSFDSSPGMTCHDPARIFLPQVFSVYLETGTAKYAINAPVVASTPLPVISPLLLMSLALARKPV